MQKAINIIFVAIVAAAFLSDYVPAYRLPIGIVALLLAIVAVYLRFKIDGNEVR